MRTRPVAGRQAELDVESIGGRGDGIGRLDGRPVFLPRTVPGDRVRARLTGARAGGTKAEVLELIEAGPGRVQPPCPHFGRCGGCALQHLEAGRYAEWKQARLLSVLAKRGLAPASVRPLLRIAPGTRRRATLAAKKVGAAVRLGFRERDSHALVDVETCLLLTPRLVAAIPILRRGLAKVLRDGQSASLALCDTAVGLDLLLAAEGAPSLAEREALAALAEAADLARLSWSEPGGVPEPVALRRPPRVLFAGVPVEPPPGGFLQPTVEGEAALVAAVLDLLPESAGRVADLFAGCGTFTFPMAARARVHAVEGDPAALGALTQAARLAGLAGRVGAETRDLARRPLGTDELARFDAAVFDPPRAGAKQQARQLARSRLATVIAVSCNAGSFARDARALVDGGYRV